MTNAANVLAQLRTRRRQAIHTLWRRDLVIALSLLLAFALFLNFVYFQVIKLTMDLAFYLIAGGSFLAIEILGILIVYMISFRKLNATYIEYVEDAIEHQSGVFFSFKGAVKDELKYTLNLTYYERLSMIGHMETGAVTCVDDDVDFFAFSHTGKDHALLLRVPTAEAGIYFAQLRNDVRVMAILNGEDPIRTFYPENVPELASFVGFASGLPADVVFFDEARKEAASTLSRFPNYRFCLTRDRHYVTLLIDGLRFHRGTSLYARLDEASFAQRLAVRTMVRTGVDIIIKTAHGYHP